MSEINPAPIKNIYQRMAEVQKKVQTVFKNETVKMSDNDKGYKAVTHDDVAAALHGPLAECGIFMLPAVTEHVFATFDKTNQWGKVVTWHRTDLKIKVKWINIDDPKDLIEVEGASFALDTSDKSYAKAYSLALKIILLKVHLLESRDNEEERSFEKINGTDGKEQKTQNNQNQNKNNGSRNQNQSAPPQQQNKQQQNNATTPPKITDDQHEQIANLMIKHSLDGQDIENFFMTAFNVKPDAVTFGQADYLIKMLSVDVFSSLDLSMAAGDLKTKREARNQTQQDPADFVIDARILKDDSILKGKKLRQIGEKDLKYFILASDEDLKDQKHPHFKLIFEANFKAKAFLKSMGV